MKKKRILIILFAMILAFAIAGCNGKNKVDKKDTEVSSDVSENETVLENETVTENENATEKEETQKTDNKKDDTTRNTETNKNNTTNKNESTSNKNETTTKPSTGSNNNTTKPSTESTANSNTGSTGNSGSTGNTQNNNTSTTTQPVHEHNWVEVTEDEIHYYAWRTICGKCKTDLTDMTSDDRIFHTAGICHSGYSTHYIEVDFVTENVVKTPVVTGYKCECGATKNK